MHASEQPFLLKDLFNCLLLRVLRVLSLFSGSNLLARLMPTMRRS